MFRAMHRLSPLNIAASIAALAGIAILVLLLAFVALQPPPIAAPMMSGPTRAGPNTNSGVDLECAPGGECGPDNPAIRVAPTPPIGPKILP
jgi:hypothetical protein